MPPSQESLWLRLEVCLGSGNLTGRVLDGSILHINVCPFFLNGGLQVSKLPLPVLILRIQRTVCILALLDDLWLQITNHRELGKAALAADNPANRANFIVNGARFCVGLMPFVLNTAVMNNTYWSHSELLLLMFQV